MKMLSLAGIVAAAVLLSPMDVSAQSNCHQSMKDMLKGTLEVMNKTESSPSESPRSEGCTVAGVQTKPDIPASLS